MSSRFPHIREQLVRLQRAEPFEPFRIKLVNGDVHDAFDPQAVAILRTIVWIFPQDQNWVVFPIDKVNSIESLMADFHGELAGHEGP